MARFCDWLLPDREQASDVAKPRHLDKSALDTPSLALANAVRETLRLGDIVEQMLNNLLKLMRGGDPLLGKEIHRLDDDIDALYTAIKLYLARMPREDLSERDSRRWAEIIELTINLEQAGDLIERMVGDVQHKKTSQQRSFSEAGLADIAELHNQLVNNLRLSLSVFLNGDLENASACAAPSSASASSNGACPMPTWSACTSRWCRASRPAPCTWA